MKLSIVIVNYNTLQLTKQTIEAVITSQTPFDYEILLVDNASADGSIDALDNHFKNLQENKLLRIIRNKENLGFSKANNIGIRASKGEYILLLNSDTVVEPQCLARCMAYIDKNNRTRSTLPRVGALGCKVILPDGTLDHACKRGFPTPLASLYYLLKLDKKNPKKYGQYNALHLGEDEIGEVDCLMGAFMLIPRRVLDQVGLLDEAFFMYGEDIDLCFRIKEGGYQVVYYPEAHLIHHKGGSSKKRRYKVIYDFHKAMCLFYTKHYKKKYKLCISLLVYMGIWCKCGLELVKNGVKGK